MSAHSIAEPNFVDTADVPPIPAAAEQSHPVHSREAPSAIQLVESGPALYTVGLLSNASPWIVSSARRCFDTVVAAVALFVLLPAMLLVMLLVRLSSPGPILFRQRRAGRNREEFTLYKFRSMRVENSPGPAITVSGDARITTIGAFLRRYKIDELPQFWNVLQGNMSLVGPRPKLPHHEALDLPYRPGITGVATLLFRNEEDIFSGVPHYNLDAFYETCIKPRKAQLDLEYMQSATLWTDLKLLWRTATSCVFGPDSLSLEETENLTHLAATWPDSSCAELSSISSLATVASPIKSGTDPIRFN
jgi:lipopolysaccharide/colanic/teichoic acid biosynthesis glycosyltransferase